MSNQENNKTVVDRNEESWDVTQILHNLLSDINKDAVDIQERYLKGDMGELDMVKDPMQTKSFARGRMFATVCNIHKIEAVQEKYKGSPYKDPMEKSIADIKLYVKSIDSPKNPVFIDNELLIRSCFAKAMEIIESNMPIK